MRLYYGSIVNKSVTRLASLWNAGVNLSRGPIARASALSLGIRLGGLALSFLQAILTARLLGPAGYGLVASILAIVQLLATVAAFGMGPVGVRAVPSLLFSDDKPRLSAILRLSARIVLALSSVLALLAALAVLPLIASQTFSLVTLVAAGLLVFPLALLPLFGGWARGFGEIAISQIPGEFIRPLLMAAGLAMCMFFAIQPGVSGYLLLTLSTAAIALVCAFSWQWWKNLRYLPPPSAGPNLREHIASALPFLGLALTTILQAQALTLLLSALSGPFQTGVFQPVARLAPIMALATQAAIMRYGPRIAELYQAGEFDTLRRITRTFTWTTTLLTTLTALAIAGAGPWIMLAFGSEFVDGAGLLWIIAAAQIFNALCGPVGTLLAMTGHGRSALAGQIAGVALLAAIAVALLPAYGALGATIAMAAGLVFNNLWQLVAVRRLLPVRPSIPGI